MADSNPVLDLILEAGRRSVESSRKVADVQKEVAAETQRLVSGAVADNKQIAANQQIITAAQRGGELAAQDSVLNIISGAGAVDTLSNLLRQSTATADRMAAEIAAVRQEQLASTGFSPIAAAKLALDWSGNQTRLQQSTQELELVSRAAQSIASQVSQVGQISKASARTITQASMQAEIDNIALTAAQQQRELALKGLQANVAGVTAVAEADDKELAVLNQVGTFKRMEDQYQLALREEERRREQFSWQREQATLDAQDKEQTRAFEERTIAYINAGEAARNLPPSSPQEIRDMIRLNKGLSTEYAELYQNGRIAAQHGQAIISTNPGKVAGVLKASPELVASLDENQKKVADLLLQAYQVLGDKAVRQREGLDDDKTGAKSQQVVATRAQELLTRQLNFVGNNPDNVFYIGDPRSYIGAADAPGIAAFQNYPLVKKVFNPAIQANVSLADVSVPFKLTLQAVASREISQSQAAADFVNIYRRMNAVHRQAADFRKFALSLPENGAQYKVKLGDGIVDVTDFQQVHSAMTRELLKLAVFGKGVDPAVQAELMDRSGNRALVDISNEGVLRRALKLQQRSPLIGGNQ